jgi:hypothetical protein
MRKEKERKGRKRKEKKIVGFRIETCRRVPISPPLYQVGAGTFVTKGVKNNKSSWRSAQLSTGTDLYFKTNVTTY